MIIKIFSIFILICSTSFAAEYTLSKKGVELKVSLNLIEDFEAKEKILNTPLLIWNKSLKYHGPSVALFPMSRLPKYALSGKALNSNHSQFIKVTTENLTTLKATNIKFVAPTLSTDRIVYNYTYDLPGKIKIISKEIILKCSNKGLKIKSVIKDTDYKKFRSVIDKLLKTVNCK